MADLEANADDMPVTEQRILALDDVGAMALLLRVARA